MRAKTAKTKQNFHWPQNKRDQEDSSTAYVGTSRPKKIDTSCLKKKYLALALAKIRIAENSNSAMLSYLNLGLRVVIGTIAGAVRLGPFVIQSLITGAGQNGREFPKAIELGAPLLRHVTNGDDDKDYFTDITITTPDGIKLHAVVDNGQRRKNGKRAIVFGKSIR